MKMYNKTDLLLDVILRHSMVYKSNDCRERTIVNIHPNYNVQNYTYWMKQMSQFSWPCCEHTQVKLQVPGHLKVIHFRPEEQVFTKLMVILIILIRENLKNV